MLRQDPDEKDENEGKEDLDSLVDKSHKPRSHPSTDFFKNQYLPDVKQRNSEIKDFLIGAKDYVKDLFSNLAPKIVLGAFLGMTVPGVISYNHEAIKGHTKRLGFSETSQIERQADALGIAVPHTTDFLAKLNDFYMKIFECYNDSWEFVWMGSNDESFSGQLMERVHITGKRWHYELPQLRNKIVPLADSLFNDFSYLKQFGYNASLAGNILEKTWDDYHDDEYHTELYTDTETYTDSDGHIQTRTVLKSRQVYDYTDNTYIYYPLAGEQSSTQLDNIHKWFPKVVIQGQFMPAKQTGAENEYAMNKSRKRQLKGRRLTNEEMLKITNSFIDGSEIFADLYRLEEDRAKLEASSNTWRAQKNTAKSYTERTYNYSHAESAEFITCENAKSYSEDVATTTNRMFSTIRSQQKRVDDILEKVKKSVSIAYHIEEGDLEQVNEEIMHEAIEGYKEMYPNGIDVESADWWHVPLWALGGGLVLGMMGWGWHEISERRKRSY